MLNFQFQKSVTSETFFEYVYSTGLSYDKSHVAVYTVVSHLQQSVPATSEVMTQIIEDLENQKVSRLSVVLSQEYT